MAIRSKSSPGALQNASKSIPRGPSSYQFQIWPRRPPKCFKIETSRPEELSDPNLALEHSKMLQIQSLEAQAATSAKSGPGDLQHALKSIPRGPSGHPLETSKMFQNRSLEAQVAISSKSGPGDKMLQNQPLEAQVTFIQLQI